MKCPKCGYISFDDLSTCTKCSTDLSAIAEELKGTGRETESDFFLGSAIKNTNLDFDDTFSSTQTLPPLESDVELDFDDTANTTQGIAFSPESMPSEPPGDDLDNTGDVALELGEIMPIDLSQLDATMEISALASQGKDEATESLPDEATMAVDLADLTSQNLEPVADDSMDLTEQLADLDSEGDDAAHDADATMALESLVAPDEEEEDNLDETIILPDLDQIDVEMAEEEGEAEDLSLDDTAAMELEGLDDIDDELEAAEGSIEEALSDEDEAVAPPDLNLDEIDLSDLVEGAEEAEAGAGADLDIEADESAGDSDGDAGEDDAAILKEVDLDSTAEALDLSALDEVEEEPAADEDSIENIELPPPENGDEIPLPDIVEDIEDEGEDGGGLPDLEVDELDFDESPAGGQKEDEPIVDLSSLIEEEGVQDDDATIELDMLSDEPTPQPESDATSEIPEIEVDMTPIDEDDDAPPDIPE